MPLVFSTRCHLSGTRPNLSLFEGVFAASLSSRRRDSDQIDLGALWELFDFLAARKVNGIVLMGSTGEFVHFSLEERVHMMGLAVKRSRLPLLINVSHSTLDGALQLAQAAAGAGAAGLLLMPPYFFRYRQDELLAFYRAFRQEIETGPPVLLYNIPVFTNPLEAPTVVELLNSGYDGIKDSSGDWKTFETIRRESPERIFLAGSDGMFSRARAAGANGAVSGIASAVPELLVALNASVERKDAERTARLDAKLGEFLGRFDSLPVPMVIREAAAARGLKVGQPAIPHDDRMLRIAGEFREWFLAWLPAVLEECGRA